MLTAAVRDLHRCSPGRFLTDVRTLCPELWAHNPHLTPIADTDPAAERIQCSYPLIDQANETPYHCLHGFVQFLNSRLGLQIQPTAFKGDLHLDPQEKAWYSQVQELTGEDIPFWIVAAGGKHDVTVKWWSTERFQEVIDHFRGRIQFVQVGEIGHWHPRLEGAIDLRGRTTLRELVRLVYHSQGVLCPITALMHLAAAVETRPGRLPYRPCVVIAGGREPAHWEAYPEHQFIHTNGALACCAGGGCWRDRTLPLRDGDSRDRPEHRCVNVVDDLPRCMDMIGSAEVIRRIETYFIGGALRYLSPRERRAAERGVAATAQDDYDRLPLNIHFAGLACDRFVRTLSAVESEKSEGRGVVICGVGPKALTGAWIAVRMLRRSGCQLPIQLWHLGDEADADFKALVSQFDVECVDARRVRRKFPVRRLEPAGLKAYAVLHSRFREVIVVDSGCVPAPDPEFLFETAPYKAMGALVWPDPMAAPIEKDLWRSCGVARPRKPGFDPGLMVFDKERCRPALRLWLWFHEQSDFYYQYAFEGSDLLRLAFHKVRGRYSLMSRPARVNEQFLWQHDGKGRKLFQRRREPWDLFLGKPVRRSRSGQRPGNANADARFEAACREYVRPLQAAWSGGVQPEVRTKLNVARPMPARRALRIETVMISCEQRNELRLRTLASLARSDWGEAPLIQFDEGLGGDAVERQLQSTNAVLRRGLERNPDYILFLEDDLLFNRNLRHNVVHWSPVRAGMVTLASLYNPVVREVACAVRHHARIVRPEAVFGSQAFLLSRATVQFLLRHWDQEGFGQDIRISRLAGRLRKPIFYHAPSLVQHVGTRSIWGGNFHRAPDFDPEWKAPPR